MTKKTRQWLIVLGLIVLAALAGWFDSPAHPQLRVGTIVRDLNVKLGLDLQGGAHLIYRADTTAIAADERADALAGVRDVIERRVNTFGVAEPLVQTNRVGDEQRIIVELAGVFDVNEAIARIGETPQLDFRREVQNEELIEQLNIDDAAGLSGVLFEPTDLSGKHLQRAVVNFDQTSGAPSVSLEFDREGSDIFAELTRNNIGRRLAINLDGVPISAPIVQTEITNGQAVISGGFTIDEARTLAQRLNAGALPVPIELIGQQTIGPSLGARSIEQSLQAGAYGLLAVAIWMIAYYRLPGVVATVSLTLYVAVFLALIKLIPVTLTLAGIAGLILSIGMAVDANVLIFERFRENIRAGKNVGYALEHGFTEAWNSIRASNVSSLITALILYGFGTSIIRGFALTFSIGILLSMFTAITVTRTLLRLALEQKTLQSPLLLGAKRLKA